MPFSDRVSAYVSRADHALDAALPRPSELPERLHDAMRYAVLNGGKRVRPLLVYATGEVLEIDAVELDAPAVAIELIHAFSLVHDDLPAMDDDELRRGKPTVHRQYDEATAILAADALQPLAFECLAAASSQSPRPEKWLAAIECIARSCGSLGMTGGQAIDLAAEGRMLTRTELETMHTMKTGRLLRAAIETAACLASGISDSERDALLVFGDALGLAFQVRDDILDVEGETETIGKTAGADAARGKATWPGLFGLDEAKKRCDELMARGLGALELFGERAEALRWMANYMISRGH